MALQGTAEGHLLRHGGGGTGGWQRIQSRARPDPLLPPAMAASAERERGRWLPAEAEVAAALYGMGVKMAAPIEGRAE